MKKLLVFAVAMTFAIPSTALASNQDQTRDRDRLKDGSCKVSSACSSDRDRTRLKLKDGSCLLASLQTKDKIRAKDGSCSA
jgi:hypothetical protein